MSAKTVYVTQETEALLIIEGKKQTKKTLHETLTATTRKNISSGRDYKRTTTGKAVSGLLRRNSSQFKAEQCPPSFTFSVLSNRSPHFRRISSQTGNITFPEHAWTNQSTWVRTRLSACAPRTQVGFNCAFLTKAAELLNLSNAQTQDCWRLVIIKRLTNTLHIYANLCALILSHFYHTRPAVGKQVQSFPRGQKKKKKAPKVDHSFSIACYLH